MPSTKPRFSLTVDDALLKEIDDFRYANRIPSRTQAVLLLLRAGLASAAKEEKE